MQKPVRRHAAALLSLCSPLALSALSLAFLCAEPQPSRAAPSETKQPAVDPKVTAALQRSASFLRSLPAFSVRASVTRDEIVHNDFNLQRTSDVRVDVRRPDRMRAEISGDQGERLFVYDGKAMNVFLKDENYYGTFSAPPSLRETLDATIDKHGVELPLADVLFVAMGGELNPDILEAGEIGTSVIDGTPCLQIAMRGAAVDWQLWLEQGVKPVPRKLVITTTDSPTRPQYSATMRWDTTTPIDDDKFAFAPPPGSMPIALGPAQAAIKHGKTAPQKPAR